MFHVYMLNKFHGYKNYIIQWDFVLFDESFSDEDRSDFSKA